MNPNKANRPQFLIEFGYDGSRFYGLQPQGNSDMPTVGGALYKRLEQAANQPPKALNFAARTDRGVHALHNVATCWFKPPFDAQQFIGSLSHPLDDGLENVRATQVPYTVHARGNSRGKHYRYLIEDNCDETTPKNPRTWQITPKLDENLMQAAAQRLMGMHDFQSFRAGGCSARTSIKTITRFEVQRSGNQLIIDIEADAFLRKMIRNLLGFLAEIGTKLRPLTDVEMILEAKDRRAAGITAPAEGLTLVRVYLDI